MALVSAFSSKFALELEVMCQHQEHDQQPGEEQQQPDHPPPISLQSRSRAQSRQLPTTSCHPPQHHIVTQCVSTEWWHVGSAAAQGFRPSMEDSCVLDLSLDHHVGVVAVFDGHGGAECADHCSAHLASALRSAPAWQRGDLPSALHEAFLQLDHQLVQCGRAPCSSGTTGTVALLQGPRLVVAGVGDSKAVLLRGGRIVPMTVDHRPNSPNEEARIRNAGGFVHQGRVNACLNVSRALGDAQFKQQADRPACQQQVSPEPDVREATVSATTDFLLVCSDGVWNSMRETAVLRFVRQRLLAGLAPDVICQQLCQACLEPCRTAYDNITAILVLFTEASLVDPAGDDGDRHGAALVPLSRGPLASHNSKGATTPPSPATSPHAAAGVDASNCGCAAAAAAGGQASVPEGPCTPPGKFAGGQHTTATSPVGTTTGAAGAGAATVARTASQPLDIPVPPASSNAASNNANDVGVGGPGMISIRTPQYASPAATPGTPPSTATTTTTPMSASVSPLSASPAAAAAISAASLSLTPDRDANPGHHANATASLRGIAAVSPSAAAGLAGAAGPRAAGSAVAGVFGFAPPVVAVSSSSPWQQQQAEGGWAGGGMAKGLMEVEVPEDAMAGVEQEGQQEGSDVCGRVRASGPSLVVGVGRDAAANTNTATASPSAGGGGGVVVASLPQLQQRSTGMRSPFSQD